MDRIDKTAIMFLVFFLLLAFLFYYDYKHTAYVTYDDIAVAWQTGRLWSYDLPIPEGEEIERSPIPLEVIHEKLRELENKGQTIIWIEGNRWKYKVRGR